MLDTDFDRTLPPTRRRREQARHEGYVVQSRILTTGVLLVLIAATWSMLGREVVQALVVYCGSR
jgi:flagellar biosynthesis protein FlhB